MNKLITINSKLMKHFFFFFLIVGFFVAQAQDSATLYIQKNAIKVELPNALNQNVYELFKPYKVLMVGEMHGTNEAAQFLKGLAELFTKNNDSILLGIEIPKKEMKQFLKHPSKENIYASKFFAHPDFESGRENYAWADLVALSINNPKIKISFFDCDTSYNNYADRDSLLFQNLKDAMLANPNRRVITISGNIHAQLITDRITMAKFLLYDRVLNLEGKICSLNEFFIRGEMINNNGSGLTKKQVDYGDNYISNAVDYDYYVLLANPKKNYPWTGIFFTRKISAAKMVKE